MTQDIVNELMQPLFELYHELKSHCPDEVQGVGRILNLIQRQARGTLKLHIDGRNAGPMIFKARYEKAFDLISGFVFSPLKLDGVGTNMARNWWRVRDRMLWAIDAYPVHPPGAVETGHGGEWTWARWAQRYAVSPEIYVKNPEEDEDDTRLHRGQVDP